MVLVAGQRSACVACQHSSPAAIRSQPRALAPRAALGGDATSQVCILVIEVSVNLLGSSSHMDS